MKDKTDCGPDPIPAPTYTCKKCKKTSDKIIVESKCTQDLSIEDNCYSHLDVQETIGGYCPECGAKIPLSVVKKLEDGGLE